MARNNRFYPAGKGGCSVPSCFCVRYGTFMARKYVLRHSFYTKFIFGILNHFAKSYIIKNSGVGEQEYKSYEK